MSISATKSANGPPSGHAFQEEKPRTRTHANTRGQVKGLVRVPMLETGLCQTLRDRVDRWRSGTGSPKSEGRSECRCPERRAEVWASSMAAIADATGRRDGARRCHRPSGLCCEATRLARTIRKLESQYFEDLRSANSLSAAWPSHEKGVSQGNLCGLD